MSATRGLQRIPRRQRGLLVVGVAFGTFLAARAVAQICTGKQGFPARSIFNARGAFHTPFGTFYSGRTGYTPIFAPVVQSLPPYGITYRADSVTSLYDVNDPDGPVVAEIVQLYHLVATGTGQVATGGSAFPEMGIDVFESIFRDVKVKVLVGPMAGTIIDVPDMVDSAQEVSRGAPFCGGKPGVDDVSTLPIPAGSSLPTVVHDSDIDFFVPNLDGTGEETIHVQLSGLDARSPDGMYRITSGRQFQDEFPNLFVPSFGVVVANSGVPASSGWGLAVMAALTAIAAAIVMVRRQGRTQRPASP